MCSNPYCYGNCPVCPPPGTWSTTIPAPAPPRPKLGDKRPNLRCKFCKNKGHINVSFVDPVTIRLTCKLCGKEESE
jgi:hypothetical protein